MGRIGLSVGAVALAALALAACSTSPKHNPTASPGAGTSSVPATTTSATGPAAVTTVLPVVDCPTEYADGNNMHPFVAKELPAATAQQGLSFYSNGALTVLGPAGWSCGAEVAGDGGQALDVYPPGGSNYSEQLAPKGAEVVQLTVDYTGHGPGAYLVCPLFPHSAAAQFFQGDPPCPAAPVGEHDNALTADIVTYTDPAGVKGTAAGSGGVYPSSGAMVYPQVTPAPQTVNVAVLSCTLPADLRDLCGAIQSDFLVRWAPVYLGTPSPNG